MTQELLVLVDESGSTLAGTGRRHVECPIHTEVIKAAGRQRCRSHALAAGGRVRSDRDAAAHDLAHATLFVPDRLARYESGDLINTVEQGQCVAATPGNHPAILLAHRDMITVGADLAEAVITAVMLERAARYQLLQRRPIRRRQQRTGPPGSIGTRDRARSYGR